MSSNATESLVGDRTAPDNASGQATEPANKDEIRKLIREVHVQEKKLHIAEESSKTGLLSPNATPEADEERNRANKERIAKEKKQLQESQEKLTNGFNVFRVKEINRIMSCPNDAYDSILDIKKDMKEEDKKKLRDLNFVTSGCLIHPTYNKDDHIQEAFDKLLEAAGKMEVDGALHAAVQVWDGNEDLISPQENENESEEDEDEPMEEDYKEVPPEWVMEIYKQATDQLKKLRVDPNNSEAVAELTRLNKLIQDDVNHGISRDNLMQWVMPHSTFTNHYKTLDELDETLSKNPTDSEAIDKRDEIYKLLNYLIERDHFPEVWRSIHEGPKPMNYPWHTAMLEDGSRIIGVRRCGKIGKRVCIETPTKEGGWIRTLEAASRVGLKKVQEYWDHTNCKNLSEGQSKWTDSDRNDFLKLHWVTKSQIQLRNDAAPKKAPTTDCCVEFKDKGIQMLTVSSLERVVGVADATKYIIEVCKNDKILCPWDSEPVSSYYNKSKLKKNRENQMALKNKAYRKSSTARKDPTIDDKTKNSVTEVDKEGLKAEIDLAIDKIERMETKVDKLVDALMELGRKMGEVTERMDKHFEIALKTT